MCSDMTRRCSPTVPAAFAIGWPGTVEHAIALAVDQHRFVLSFCNRSRLTGGEPAVVVGVAHVPRFTWPLARVNATFMANPRRSQGIVFTDIAVECDALVMPAAVAADVRGALTGTHGAHARFTLTPPWECGPTSYLSLCRAWRNYAHVRRLTDGYWRSKMVTGLPWPSFTDEEKETIGDETWAWICRVVLFRDAHLLALTIKDGNEAAAIFTNARASGDDILAAALMDRASVCEWVAVLELCDEATRGDLESLTKFPEWNGGL